MGARVQHGGHEEGSGDEEGGCHEEGGQRDEEGSDEGPRHEEGHEEGQGDRGGMRESSRANFKRFLLTRPWRAVVDILCRAWHSSSLEAGGARPFGPAHLYIVWFVRSGAPPFRRHSECRQQ